MSRGTRIGLGVLGLACLAAAARADTPQADPPSNQQGPAGKGKVQFVSPEVARLDLFVGTWVLKQSHLNADGEVVSTVKGTEEITWVLDHRAIQRSYKSGADEKPFRALCVLSWNDLEKKYNGYWFDNSSTAGPAEAKGEWQDDTRSMVFAMESLDAEGQAVRYRVVEQFIDNERRVATTYLLQGDELVKQMVVTYRRAVPCPDRIRTIFDDAPRAPNRG